MCITHDRQRTIVQDQQELLAENNERVASGSLQSRHGTVGRIKVGDTISAEDTGVGTGSLKCMDF